MTSREVLIADAPNAVGGLKNTNWIILDSSGQEIVHDAQKHAIMHRVQINALNLEHIKAIFTSEEVLLRDALDDNDIPILEVLRRRLQQVNGSQEELPAAEDDVHIEKDDSPFEFRMVEMAMESICGFLSARTLELTTEFYLALDMLKLKVNRPNLDRLRKLKSPMTSLTARVRKVRGDLEQLLDDDDLTRRGDRNRLKMLLKAYFMQIDGTLTNLTKLREHVRNTQDSLFIQIEKHRNHLIRLLLFLGAVAIPSLIAAGIFGLNIPGIWDKDDGFLFQWGEICIGFFGAVFLINMQSYGRFKDSSDFDSS